MMNFLMVALGGALGSVLRYSAGFGVASFWPQHLYIATVLVNIIGCFLIGCAFSWFILRPDVSAMAPLLLMTGFLGGFTTFSTFSLDALRIFNDGQPMQALLYMGVTLVGGLLATWLGMALIKISL
ncbi:MAG TPA: fluoride efflux transporter CrcB [Gammaproteobacteria bacterium]|nr:fluoride efflux transporter CrcB [Gammaproteobacteria bacterium]